MQIMRTAEALRDIHIDIDVRTGVPESLANYDLAHLFHLDRLWENGPLARRLIRRRCPYVLSPIYWSRHRFNVHGRLGAQRHLARAVGPEAYRNLHLMQRSTLHGAAQVLRFRWSSPMIRFRRWARHLLAHARVILPNSRIEGRRIAREFGIERPCVVVPNAVDPELFHWTGGPDGAREGVLCVGRLEPRKNQLALLRAWGRRETPLTIVGGPGPFSARYAMQCRAEAGPGVRLLGHVPAHRLPELYRAAAVHCAPSWYETPGLASLEAAVCGCRIVVTRGGSTREYFGDDAWYCRTNDPESIRETIDEALAAPPTDVLAHRIHRDFTWTAAAQRTLEAYRTALGEERPSPTLP